MARAATAAGHAGSRSRAADRPGLGAGAQRHRLGEPDQGIEAEPREYRQLRDGRVPLAEAPAVDEVPRVLAKARIRSGLSRGALAAHLDTTAEQVQRFELSYYAGASLDTLLAVSRAVGIDPA